MARRAWSDTRASRAQPVSLRACGVRRTGNTCCMRSVGGGRCSRSCCVGLLQDLMPFRSLGDVDIVLEELDIVSSTI